MPSPFQIASTFAQVFRPLGACRARRLARLIGEGALDDAVRQAAHDDASDALDDLLAYREALRERREPLRLRARLQAEADDLDRRCARLDEAAAEGFGKAAYRQSRGDRDLAAEANAQAQAAETAAARLREQALAFRLRAAAIDARLASARVLSDVAASA